MGVCDLIVVRGESFLPTALVNLQRVRRSRCLYGRHLAGVDGKGPEGRVSVKESGEGNEGGLTQSEGKTESEESGTISYIP